MCATRASRKQVQMPKRPAASLVAALLLLSSLRTAGAVAGDSFLGDLVTAGASPINGGTYKDTAGGYGTVSVIDNGEEYSWEVDIFQAPVPTTIELVLASAGLPKLLTLTNEAQPDGISFGLLSYADLAAAIAASANPSASLKDGTVGVVAKFAKPAGSALMCFLSDGNTVITQVAAPPSPPASAPPAPDMNALHPGVTPDIYFSQLDGTQVSILETGILNAGNGTASILVYGWKDGTYTWELENNNIATPLGLQLRVFVDLVNTPLVLNMTADQPWAPETLSYSGTFTDAELQAGLLAAGVPDASLINHTPNLFLEILDAGGVTQDELVESAAPSPDSGPVGTIKERRRHLLQAGNGTGMAASCSAEQPSRIIGFLFDSASRYKLKPVLKDTNSLPNSVEMIPLYASGAVLFLLFITFVAMYISGTLEAASG